ncbi:hypothetical protein [Methylibium petroleiphilum]|uniref:Uncharacterized protein n=1 Tax=Methylibium petroleiphilum (strain ATCC BAA-1232 / LMG 22953 / PM1) TaxID=420662 RepID=A2SD70_METPP|nr:hypothetical protein [Methylibium petroleiphilum]ABM93509.1 hypothetical protein Mpe_A0547 [Methylibium petroleiphilum PM1]
MASETLAPVPANIVLVRDDQFSFVSETYTRRKRLLFVSFFDVPEEHFYEGKLTGIRAAREMFTALSRDSSVRNRFVLQEALKEAMRIKDEQTDFETKSRQGAANGFVSVMHDALFGAAQIANPEYFEKALSLAHQDLVFVREQSQKMKTARSSQAH